MSPARALRGAALTLLLAVLALAVITWRAVREGEAALLLSDTAFNQGDLRTATLEARRAAVAYAPGAPHVDRAYARLMAIALGAEASGRREAATEAWRAVRGAALESRHAWIPRAQELERANRAIARLESADAPDRQAAARAALERLKHDRQPRPLYGALLVFGFLCATGGFAGVALRGVRSDGSVSRRPFWIGAGLAVLGVLCWSLAVWRA